MTTTPTGTQWWVARERHSLTPNFYVISDLPLQRRSKSDAVKRDEEVYWYDTDGKRPICNDDLWNALNAFKGVRLSPGDGPVQVTLRLTVRLLGGETDGTAY